MRYAPLAGWVEHPELHGWLYRPGSPGWLRTRDGRWWDERDVREGRIEMTPAGPRIVPGWFLGPDGNWVNEFGGSDSDTNSDQDVIAELRRDLGEVTGA